MEELIEEFEAKRKALQEDRDYKKSAVFRAEIGMLDWCIEQIRKRMEGGEK